MSTLTLPRIAADLDGTGHAWWAFTSALGDTLWCAQPILPDASFAWAVDVETPHLTLDSTAVAELLYASGIDPARPIGNEQLAALVLAEVARCHCSLTAAIEILAQDAGDHPHECAERMRGCLALADRLLGGAQ